MPVQTLNQKLSPGGSVTLPAGYYAEGTSVISVSTLAEAAAANAASSHILSGYSGWVNGVLVNGSMVNRGNVSRSLGANGSYTIPAGWHAGSGKVSQSLTTQGGKTVTPKTTNQTAVAANRWTTGNIIVAGASTLTAGNIRNGITIFGIRGTFTGWVDSSMTAYTITESTGTYRQEIKAGSGDSDPSYWTHQYVTATKTLSGWNIITATLTNYDLGLTKYYNMLWVYVKVVNDGLAWYPGLYLGHDTWNYWRSCWFLIGRLGNPGDWIPPTTTISKTVSGLGYTIAYACDAWCSKRQWPDKATITVTFSK